MTRCGGFRWAGWLLTCVVAVTAASGGVRVRAQRGADPGGEWRTYGGDLGNTKYSPLDQINAGNFGRLKVAWRWKSADAFLSLTLPGGGELWASRAKCSTAEAGGSQTLARRRGAYVNNFKATPLMAGGRLFLNMPTSVGAAIDARTGEMRWVFNPKSYEAGTTTMIARWNQRGVAYWTDGKEQRIYWGTGDGYLRRRGRADRAGRCEGFGSAAAST